VTQTSKTNKTAMDRQIARFLYGTNTPFSAVGHPEFVKLVQLLRPGYNPPNKFCWKPTG